MSDALLTAAYNLAKSFDGGVSTLHDLVRQKFIYDRLAKIGTLAESRVCLEALGKEEFWRSVVSLSDAKVLGIVKRLDKHNNGLATLSASKVRERLMALSSGDEQPFSPPQSALAPTRPRTPARPAVPLPDMRTKYSEGGISAVVAALQGLTLAQLRKVVTQQELKCSEAKVDTAAGLKKYIQQSVKEELGSRGDPIGALQRMPEDAG